MAERADGRKTQDLRPLGILVGVQKHAWGSVILSMGDTRVLCAATVEETVPPFLKGKGQGWVTAEYSMLPASTDVRTSREGNRARSMEIQRLIGRALRAVTTREILGERSFIIDCDVIQADGGTRCAAITGAYVALRQAFAKRLAGDSLTTMPLTDALAAISAGVVDGVPLLDLTYEEDSRAEVDFNVVMTAGGEFVEVQGSAESHPFARATMDQLLGLAAQGIRELLAAQTSALGEAT